MFESYKKGATKPPSDPEVTILRKGSMHLNIEARHLLGDPEFVELLFDRDRDVIGVRASSGDSDSAYKLSGVRDAFWTISLISFLKFYEIEITESRRRVATLENDILCVDLREPGIVVDRKSA